MEMAYQKVLMKKGEFFGFGFDEIFEYFARAVKENYNMIMMMMMLMMMVVLYGVIEGAKPTLPAMVPFMSCRLCPWGEGEAQSCCSGVVERILMSVDP